MTKKTLFLIPSLVLTFALNTLAAEMRVLGHDTPALQTRVDLIKSAKHEILVEYFEVAQDKLTLIGLGLLQEAARRGVKVKVLVDSMHNDVNGQQFAAMMNTLNTFGQTKNFEIKVFNPLDNLNLPDQTYRNHDKLFIVDGKFAIIGGRNVSGAYFGHAQNGKPNLRDVDVLTYGEEVSENQTVNGQTQLSPREYFMQLWNKNPMVKDRALYEFSTEQLTQNCYFAKNSDMVDDCERLRKNAIARIGKAQAEVDEMINLLNSNQGEAQKGRTWGVSARPTSEAALRKGMYPVNMVFMYNDPTQVMKNVKNKLAFQLGAYLQAKQPRQMTLLTPYLFPTPSTLDLFSDLSKKGTKMKIISNSLNSTDSTLVYAAYQTIKPQLLDMKAEIYEYNGPLNDERQPTILHTKMLILDEESQNPTAMIGSFNLDQRSALINREIAVIISGGDTKGLTKDLLREVNYVQRVSTLSDGSPESNAKIMNMATPEKREQLDKDSRHPVLLIKKLNKHI